MKRKGFQACMLVMILTGPAGWRLGAETIVLSGSVRTMEGTQLATRISILRGSPNTGIETHDTAAEGTFSISTSREGVQVVRAGATGYAGSEIALLPSGPLPSLDFRLAKLRPVEGTVRSLTGVAQAGVPVGVRYIDRRVRMRMDDDAAAVTDENGAFKLLAAGGGGGRFVVDALPDDWVPVSSAILGAGAVGHVGAASGNSAIRDVLVELRAGGAQLAGQVASSAGEVQAGVIVRAVIRTAPDRVDEGSRPGLGTGVVPGGVADRPFARMFTKVVETGRRGNYAIQGLPAGSLTLTARRIGGKPAVRALQLLDGESVTVDFTLLDAARAPRPDRAAPVPVPSADPEP